MEDGGPSAPGTAVRPPLSDAVADRLERRCPRLGGAVRFGYCRRAGDTGGPCWKCLDCWWERFDVVAHLRRRIGPDALAELTTRRPRPKLTSVVDQIRAARARTAGNAGSGSAPMAQGGEDDH